MLCCREMRVYSSWRKACQVHLLAVYELLHVLDESVYDAKSLSCRGSPSLIYREPVLSLWDRPNVFVPEKLLINLAVLR